MAEPTTLFDTAPPMPDLSEYDVILVNSSAGKDSQAMLDYVAELARAAEVLDRVTVLHNALGHTFKADLSMAEVVAAAGGGS